MSDRIIRCVGRRRITISQDDGQTRVNIWLRDPPKGRCLASLLLETPLERDKLMLELTETKVNE